MSGLGLMILLASVEARAGWSLVGVYDSAALLASSRDEDTPRALWVASPGMTRSCGPAKAPDGLGLFEAETLANGDAPALAILLESSDRDGPLGDEDVRVSLGLHGPEIRLYPAVSPRALAVTITGPGALRHKQLVRTQLEMELCMEHKVGRGWIGGDGVGLRQAFLLDPPAVGGPDRKAFGGQRDPVPALLGPPDACLHREEGLNSSVVGGQGEGSLDLVPSDVWGAGLRWCGPEEVGGAAAVGLPGPIALHLSGDEASPPPRERIALNVEIGAAEDDLDVKYTLRYGDEVLASDAPLFSAVPATPGQPAPSPGIQDLLAGVPYAYPSLGPPKENDRYALLLVPNWQVAEALRRLKAGKPGASMGDGGVGVIDAVGEVLSHPELLTVQVPGAGGSWVNLSGALRGEPWGLRDWGYSAGMLTGRAPIALPGFERPSWESVSEAHRAGRHSLFLGAFAVAAGLCALGLRRLRDLWTPSPVERVTYWPDAEGDTSTASAPPAPGKA